MKDAYSYMLPRVAVLASSAASCDVLGTCAFACRKKNLHTSFYLFTLYTLTCCCFRACAHCSDANHTPPPINQLSKSSKATHAAKRSPSQHRHRGGKPCVAKRRRLGRLKHHRRTSHAGHRVNKRESGQPIPP